MTFIGSKPTNNPEYTTPFGAAGSGVHDATCKVVVTLDTGTPGHNRAIAGALNEKFDSRPEPVRLRTLLAWRRDGSFVESGRVYEVSAGLFVWATSRAAAEERSHFGRRLSNESYRFVDAETGETID